MAPAGLSVSEMKTCLGINSDSAWKDFSSVARHVYAACDFDTRSSWTQIPAAKRETAVNNCILNLSQTDNFSSFKADNLPEAFMARLSWIHNQESYRVRSGKKGGFGKNLELSKAEESEQRRTMSNEETTPMDGGDRASLRPPPQSPITDSGLTQDVASEKPKNSPDIDTKEAELDRLIREQKQRQQQLLLKAKKTRLAKKTSLLRKLEEETELLERELEAEEAAPL